MSYADDEGANRPKLSLQPRGSAADMSSASPVKTSRVSLCSFFRDSVTCGVCQNVKGYDYVARTKVFPCGLSCRWRLRTACASRNQVEG
jgi:hypothetical protein